MTASRVIREHGNNRAHVAMVAVLACLLLTWSLATAAAVPGEPISRDDPEVMLQLATAQLLQVTREARDYATDNPERYYTQVIGILDQVVDTQYFARSVMATYGSTRLYKSLKTEAERETFRNRVIRFTAALKRVWMVKYANVLLRYNAETIALARIESGADRVDRASIKQTIKTDDQQVYVAQYSLRKGSDDSWLIINVIAEGINLGETYRSQFADAVEKHKGDVDYVVEHWADEVAKEDAAVAADKS